MESIITLTDDLFQKIYSDPKFRNAIAGAHKYNYNNSNDFEWHASLYPQKFKVTTEQIEIAKQERKKANLIIRDKFKNVLLFKGMGSEFSPRWEDDITNHRIRSYFKNRHGRLFFIEILAVNDRRLFVDCSQSIDDEIEFKNKQKAIRLERDKYNRIDIEYAELQRKLTDFWREQPTANYGGIRKLEGKYICTKSDIITMVNDVFECDFKSMVIDDYDIIIKDSDYDVFCESPFPDHEPADETIISESDFIESHRSKYPLPFDELTMYSSYDQVLGKTPEDYTPAERFQRWTSIMKQSEYEIQEYFQETNSCQGCIYLDIENYWCKSHGLPNAYNPILKGLGMACGGVGKTNPTIQLSLF